MGHLSLKAWSRLVAGVTHGTTSSLDTWLPYECSAFVYDKMNHLLKYKVWKGESQVWNHNSKVRISNDEDAELVFVV